MYFVVALFSLCLYVQLDPFFTMKLTLNYRYIPVGGVTTCVHVQSRHGGLYWKQTFGCWRGGIGEMGVPWGCFEWSCQVVLNGSKSGHGFLVMHTFGFKVTWSVCVFVCVWCVCVCVCVCVCMCVCVWGRWNQLDIQEVWLDDIFCMSYMYLPSWVLHLLPSHELDSAVVWVVVAYCITGSFTVNREISVAAKFRTGNFQVQIFSNTCNLAII